MQSLDVSISGPFKQYYNEDCSDWMFRHPGRALTIYDITGLSGQAYYRPLIHANMKSGLAKKDIFPLNREVFTYDLLPPPVPTDREEEIFRDIPDEDLD